MELFDVNCHFKTKNNIIIIGNSINEYYFLLNITISKNKFLTNEQDESCIFTKSYDNKYYKIKITLYPLLEYYYTKKYRYYMIFRDLKNEHKNIYKLFEANKFTVELTNQFDFSYKNYNIPRDVWIIASGLILGEV
jgi:hypothetical protein